MSKEGSKRKDWERVFVRGIKKTVGKQQGVIKEGVEEGGRNEWGIAKGCGRMG